MRDLIPTLMGGVFAASLLAGCSGSNNPTSPSNGGNTPPPTTGQGGNTSPPSTAAVNIGDIFFKSAKNGSSNPAVDTVAMNGTVTWTWTVGDMPHSVHSMGSPSFTSSAIQTGSGKTYQFQFTAAGSYQYDCAVHGTLMTGMIVVLDPSGSSTPPPSMPPPPSTPPPPGY
jgi:plastocyanin